MANKNRPLIWNSTLKGLKELTDRQLETLVYLVQAKYAEKLKNTSTAYHGQVVLSSTSPGAGWSNFGTAEDHRRKAVTYGYVLDDNTPDTFGTGGLDLMNFTGDTATTQYEPRVKFNYHQLSKELSTPSQQTANADGYTHFTTNMSPAGLIPAGNDMDTVINAITKEVCKEMKTGNGIGTYYVGLDTDTTPGTFKGTFEKLGDFFQDTYSSFANPTVSNLGSFGQNFGSAVTGGALPTGTETLGNKYSLFIKTGLGDDFNLNTTDRLFDNVAKINGTRINLMEFDTAVNNDATMLSRYAGLNDMIEKIILPALTNDSTPTYAIQKDSKPSSKIFRGYFEDSYLSDSNTFDFRLTAGTTYVYQQLDIPTGSNFSIKALYLKIAN